MTCKDCLHYDVCEELEQKNGIPKTFACQCAFFKDKSDYAEVVHGEWIYDYSGECVPGTDAPLCQKCSECGEYTVNEENFCPNCGAKMDGGKAE